MTASIPSFFPPDTPSVPSPTNVQLRFINASAVLITWAHPLDPSPLSPIQYLIQVSHDGDPYQNSSDLLNVTEFVYSGMKYSAYYQFKVIAYRGGMASSPTETNYFLNGITGVWVLNVLCHALVAACGLVVKALDCGLRGHRFKSHSCY